MLYYSDYWKTEETKYWDLSLRGQTVPWIGSQFCACMFLESRDKSLNRLKFYRKNQSEWKNKKITKGTSWLRNPPTMHEMHNWLLIVYYLQVPKRYHKVILCLKISVNTHRGRHNLFQEFGVDPVFTCWVEFVEIAPIKVFSWKPTVCFLKTLPIDPDFNILGWDYRNCASQSFLLKANGFFIENFNGQFLFRLSKKVRTIHDWCGFYIQSFSIC